MALVVKDRVKETTSSTGTGTITLAGAVSGFQSFSVIGDGNTTYYTITNNVDWEVGIGTYTSSGTTLSRDTILESSNGGAAVNFGAGTKDVFVTYPAEKSISDGYGLLPVTNGGTGTSTQFTAGSVVFAGASGVYSQDNANLFWDDTNNQLGLGTNAPGYRLDVASGDASFGYAARLRSNATATAAIFQFTNSAVTQQNGLLGVTDAGVLTLQADGAASLIAFRTNGAERARIDSSGNVGIGTSSPTSRLTITGGVTEIRDGNYLMLRPSGNAWDMRLQATGTQLDILSGGSLGSPIMSLLHGGNVGIGTSSPGYKLDVLGNIRSSGTSVGQVALQPGAATNSGYVAFNNAAGTRVGYVGYANDSSGVFLINSEVATNAMTFSTAATERARIGSNGAFALGGTGTDATLHIQQAYGGFDRLTQISPNAASKNAFNIMAAKNASSADLWWSWGVRNDNVWAIEQGVNYNLNSSIGFFFDSGGQAYKSGGGSWAAISDARVKTNIAPISDAASRIMALKPSIFDYRVPEAHQDRVSDRGFIAQEFEEVYPHSVSESTMAADAEKALVAEDGKTKAISLNNDFFADLVALVQEQQVTINELRARVAQLEGK